MPKLIYDGQTYERLPAESILECLTRHRISIPHSCKSGICQSCMMRAVNSTPPDPSQKGLKESLKQQGYFLSCACVPSGDFEATSEAPELIRVPARVISIDKLSRAIARVRLDHARPYEYRSGQFINLRRDDGLTRPYSIASLPDRENYLEIHVRHIEKGRMSSWIHDGLKVGDELEISTPLGECYYHPGLPEQALLLIGTGCGLAPLYGIIRDALHNGHAAPIWLFHGSHTREGLYLVDELRQFANDFDNFHYVPCLTGGDEAEGFDPRRAHEAALAQHPDMKDWRVYLCGHQEMVTQTRKKAFLAGAKLSDIHADPFISSA